MLLYTFQLQEWPAILYTLQSFKLELFWSGGVPTMHVSIHFLAIRMVCYTVHLVVLHVGVVLVRWYPHYACHYTLSSYKNGLLYCNLVVLQVGVVLVMWYPHYACHYTLSSYKNGLLYCTPCSPPCWSCFGQVVSPLCMLMYTFQLQQWPAILYTSLSVHQQMTPSHSTLKTSKTTYNRILSI